jgi:hypothetical protein
MIATIKADHYTRKQKKLAVKAFSSYKNRIGKRLFEALRVKEILQAQAEMERSIAQRVRTNYADQDYYGAPKDQY